MNKSLLNKFDPLSLSLIGFALLLSLYSFYFFISNKIYLIGSDAFYYISISDSILQYGKLSDITDVSNGGIKTPQNGIAFVHVILSILGIGAKSRILTIVFINYFLYLSGVYPLYKIARWSGVRRGLPLASLLSVYFGAWHIYRINLLAINDGIFNSMMLWLVYLIMKFILLKSEAMREFKFNPDIKRFIGIVLIVMISIHFRINVVLVIGSALVSSLVVRNYRVAAWFLSVCALLLISFFAVYYFVKVGRFDSVFQRRFIPMFTSSATTLSTINLYTIKFQLWKILPRLVAGLPGLSNPLATLLFTIFPLCMIFCGIKGIIDKDFNKVFISLICLTGLWFTMSFRNARMIWYTFPFIYLILLENKKSRIAGYLFVLLVFVQSLQQFYTGFRRGPQPSLYLYIHDKPISIDTNSILLTNSARHTYFLLDIRAYRWRGFNDNLLLLPFPKELTWNLIQEKGSLFVLGDSTYIDGAYSQVQEMASLNSYKFESSPLTPDLEKFEGWALVELSLSKSQ